MVYICIILGIICITEFIVILWLRRAEKKKLDIEDTIRFYKRMWGTFVIYVIATSIIGLFIASFVMKEEITLSKMNEWVSLVLGLVALIIGIISLFLSFYNVDQAYKMQEDNLKKMTELQKTVENKINSLDNNMQKGFSEMKTSKSSRKSNNIRIKTKETNREMEME